MAQNTGLGSTTAQSSQIDSADLLELIREAVRESVPVHPCLSDEEPAWVRIAIRREAQRIAFRQSVIDKTLVGLIWSGIVGIGVIVREYAVSHGVWRP